MSLQAPSSQGSSKNSEQEPLNKPVGNVEKLFDSIVRHGANEIQKLFQALPAMWSERRRTRPPLRDR